MSLTSLGRICQTLLAGIYTVVETPKPGWTASTATTQTVTVTGGTTANIFFGNRSGALGKLCIYKFRDSNGNGVRDTGELLLPNWSFTVTDLSGASTTLGTSSTGGCAGAGFPAGSYTVVEQPQNYWLSTTATTQTVLVTAGTTANAYFGNRPITATIGQLCIYKFKDLNGNGVRDTGEPLLPNWSFTVTDSSGASTTFVTDSLGRICNSYPSETYIVVETPQAGWTATTPTTQTVIILANTTTNAYFGNR